VFNSKSNPDQLQKKFAEYKKPLPKEVKFHNQYLAKFETKICDNRDIVRHAKIPIPTIGRNVVKVGDEVNSYGYGYVLNKRMVLVPSHYVVVSHIHIKESASAKVKKIPCELVSELQVPGHLEGVKLLAIAQDQANLPFNGVKLNIPVSEFPGLIISPAFSQVSSVKYSPDNGLLIYTADSTEGDCGQAVVDTETNQVVGFHIGVNRLNKQARVAYALALTPKLLNLINKKVEELGF
jgi:hypothetical protein